MSATATQIRGEQQPHVDSEIVLPFHLEASWQILQLQLRHSIAAKLQQGKSLCGRYYYYNGWTAFNITAATKPAMLALTGVIFFGDLWNDRNFSTAVLCYAQDPEQEGWLYQMIPSPIKSLIYNRITKPSSAQTVLRAIQEIRLDSTIKKSREESILSTVMADVNQGSQITIAFVDKVLSAWLHITHQASEVLAFASLKPITNVQELPDLDSKTGTSSIPDVREFYRRSAVTHVVRETMQATLTPESTPTSPKSDYRNTSLPGLLEEPYIKVVATLVLSLLLLDFDLSISPETRVRLESPTNYTRLQSSEIIALSRDRRYVEDGC